MKNKDTQKTENFFSPELLTDPSMDYEIRRERALEAAKNFLEYHRERIKGKHRAGASGIKVVGSLTSMADTLVRNLYRVASVDVTEECPGSCALIAIGGYGRGELNPRSDIDLMFLYGGGEKCFAEKVSERILYLMWDLGLDVGYSVRTEKDCLDMGGQDITARTAMLDARFLVGDEELYRNFETGVLETLQSTNSGAFIREKLKENERRLKKYGSSIYLLEPNIKEGEGGLRDLQMGLWVARVKFKARNMRELVIKGVVTEEEAKQFDDATDYLWRIRNELHYLSSRKNDQIHFDQQENIAHFLGYRDNRRALAVEQFMQEFYAHATEVEHLASLLVVRSTTEDTASIGLLGYLTRRTVEDGFYALRGELRLSKPDLFEKDPAAMIKAFRLAQQHDVELSLPLKAAIRENLHRINDRVRRSKVMTEGFREILRFPKRAGSALRMMHHLRFLDRFIPEFGRIFCKVQHDAYHIYTVDIHSLFAVEEITRLWEGKAPDEHPLLLQVANDVEKKDLLLLSILLHDIGKGEGKDHCNKGADMIPTIARRLGLNKEDSQRLEFLVRNHLRMAHISQRRDMHDDKLIIEFARSMGMSENLKMLYLLTYADIRAVGPDVWSEWKDMLLRELYEKAYEVLERGNFRSEKRSEKVRNRKRKIVGILEGEFEGKTVKDVLKGMSTRYLLSYRSAVISEHIRLILGRKERSLALKVEHEPEGKYSQVTITTLDIPGLFSRIAGVMAANGINILGAQIFTQLNGTALDILQVAGSAGGIIDDVEKWKRVEESLTAVIEGRQRVGDLVKKRKKASFLPEKAKPRRPNRVEIENEVSDEYTVVDIYAHDRVGLLYDITNTIKELGLYIGVSKISTKVDQAADTFYLQDIFGQKITQPAKLEELRTRLLECLPENE